MTTEHDGPEISTVRITLLDDRVITFTTLATRGITPSLLKAMQATGYLTLWNNDETLCLSGNHIKHFTMADVKEDK